MRVRGVSKVGTQWFRNSYRRNIGPHAAQRQTKFQKSGRFVLIFEKDYDRRHESRQNRSEVRGCASSTATRPPCGCSPCSRSSPPRTSAMRCRTWWKKPACPSRPCTACCSSSKARASCGARATAGSTASARGCGAWPRTCCSTTATTARATRCCGTWSRRSARAATSPRCRAARWCTWTASRPRRRCASTCTRARACRCTARPAARSSWRR